MRLGAAVLGAVLGAAPLLPGADVAVPDALLADGIALVQQGDFEAAVLKLDEASRRLATDPSRKRPLADAYLYLGIAFLELNQELNARAKFREVLKVEPTRKLSDRVFSPQIIRVFEAARVEMFPNETKERSILPLLLIVGGGAASAGVAIATSGGDTPTPPPSTTSTTLSGTGGGNATTTTTTTPGSQPGPNPTTTTTILPGSTTSSTSTTFPPTTIPGCTFALEPPERTFGGLLGGMGTCAVTTNNPTCAWTAVKGGEADGSWITFTTASSGTGSGPVGYSIPPLSIGTRTGFIRVGTSECVIVQTLIPLQVSDSGSRWESTLEVAGGRGQIVIDGAIVRYQDRGTDQGFIAPASGTRQVVAHVVTAKGSGTWTFRLPGGGRPGSLRPVGGDAVRLTADSIVFRLSGKPGERVVFTFEAQP